MVRSIREPGPIRARSWTVLALLMLAGFVRTGHADGLCYGGIHFAQGDLTGRSLGRVIGAAVWTKAKTWFDGTAYDNAALPESHPHPPARVVRR